MPAPDCSPLVKQFSCRRCRHPAWSRLRRRSFQRCFARRSGSQHGVDPVVILSRVSAPISFRAWCPPGFRRRWAIDNLSPRDATVWKQRKRFPWSLCGPICSELRSDETFFVSSRSHDVLWQSHALEKFRVLDLGRLVDAHEKNQRVGPAVPRPAAGLRVSEENISGALSQEIGFLNHFGCEVKSSKVESIKSSQVKS